MFQKQHFIRLSAICFTLVVSFFKAYSQEFIPLWPNGKMPNSKGMQLKDSIANERIYRVGTPGMYAFFPSRQENKSAAVVICPGGGYERLAYGSTEQWTTLCEAWMVEMGFIPQIKQP